MLLLLCAVLLLLLWGGSWFSGIILSLYILAAFYLVFSIRTLPFICYLSDRGHIEVQQPTSLVGHISRHSFYNRWIIFLCVEETNKLLLAEQQKDNKPKKWFVILKDSIEQREFYLLARLVNSSR